MIAWLAALFPWQLLGFWLCQSRCVGSMWLRGPKTGATRRLLHVPALSEIPSSPAPLALVALSRWLHLFLIITIFSLFCCRQVCSGFLFKASQVFALFVDWLSVKQQLLPLSSPHYSVKKKVIFFIINVITATTIIIYLLHDSISEPSDKRSRL